MNYSINYIIFDLWIVIIWYFYIHEIGGYKKWVDDFKINIKALLVL